MTSPQESEHGFALVTALWALAILSVIVASVSLTARTEARLSRNRRELAELGAIADAAINIAILNLTDRRLELRPPVDATPFIVNFGGQGVRVSVQDEAGKVDLNQASEDLLVRLLGSGGLDDAAAQALADKIMDWREPGIGKRLNGAKAEDYQTAGYAYGPRNGPFESIEELKLVMGMKRELFDRVAASVTVYAQGTDVNPAVAPAGVLSILPGADPNRTADILEQRAKRATGGLDDNASPVGLETTSLSGRAFSIVAEAQGRDLMKARHTAIIRLSGLQAAPIWIYRWD